ncbi:MAG: acyl-CoA dehydrogenase [Deltaproteobacteria bacterium CG11_big_fil_rev_8_21_14_0_20_49_13]|nr:MAG: acyl-CoA dehydrogenase [Deltaproteobacteria bacterium CG11_big_fil_rev_8_21_14_0_20_49_13]
MEMTLSEEQKMLQQMAHDFAQKELAPKSAELDESEKFPADAVKKMAELGLMGITIPVEWGGAGMDNLAYVLALEEISAACASTAVTMSVNDSLYCAPIVNFGTDAQKEKYVKPFASGQKLGAYALSEPGTGSDAANQRTVAVKKGNKYILNGTKNFITNGPDADAMMVFAMTDKEKRHKGISAFIVEKGFSGYSVGKKEHKLGIRASSTSSIVLDNCEVPEENIIGKEGGGFSIAMWTLDGGRLGIATQALGISRAAFEVAVRYSTEREAFDKPICEFEGIQWKIADMAMRIDASRLLVHRAAWMKDKGMKYSKEAAMAKLFSSETANFVAKEAVQILGGYGYCKEYPVERYFRDAKITEIYEGTSEVQRIVIAKNVLKELAS